MYKYGFLAVLFLSVWIMACSEKSDTVSTSIAVEKKACFIYVDGDDIRSLNK